MGYINIAMIALTAVALLFGILYGMGRGRNRSILRLILIIGCILGAVFLRETVVNIILESNVGKELMASLSKEVPTDYQNIVLLLVSIIFNIIVYFLLFFVLRIVSWLILFPILKIFVRTELDKSKGMGAIIGLIQGVVVAFAVLVPLNGLFIQMDRLSRIEMKMPQTAQEEQVNPEELSFKIPKEFGLSEYVSSGLCSIYEGIGGWYFNEVTTANVDNKKLNLRDVCDVAIGATGIVSSASDIEQGFRILQSGTATDAEIAKSLKELGASISEKGEQINAISKDAKQFLNDIVSSAMGENTESEFTIDDIKLYSFGKAFTAIGEFYEDKEVTETQATDIINGMVDNWALIEGVIKDATLIDLEGTNEQNMRNALQSVNEEQKTKIMKLFGISA